jgi:carbon storage regulator CsrA
MLILSRKSCESVIVGDPATCDERMLKITVLKIGKGSVRLGFQVGGDVPVHRCELLQRIRSNVSPSAGEQTSRQTR